MLRPAVLQGRCMLDLMCVSLVFLKPLEPRVGSGFVFSSLLSNRDPPLTYTLNSTTFFLHNPSKEQLLRNTAHRGIPQEMGACSATALLCLTSSTSDNAI
jgi:hypothetical protein